jgi:hypothetical protein
MRPWQHARSSAGRGRDWQEDLPIHEFMDSTKAACPDLRHRLVLHNADLGPELAARAFPDRADARAIALRHVEEDLGAPPRLGDWIACCDPARLPRPLARRLPIDPAALALRIARAQGLPDAREAEAVLDLLLLPVSLAGPLALPVLFNGAGPAVVRQVMGPPRRVPGAAGGYAMVDPAHLAEALIHHLFGTLMPLPEVLRALVSDPVSRNGTSR